MEHETLDAAAVIAVFHDVPKWEHTDGGGLRLKGPENGGNGDGVAAAQTETQASL